MTGGAKTPVTVGVIGLGVGEQHAKAFAADPRCHLKWLCDVSQGQLDAVSARVGASEITTDAEAVLTDPAVDVVALASFDHLHHAQVLKAFETGKHVFVEKPLCRTTEELTEVHAAWQAAGRPQLTSNLVLRAAPLYAWLKEAVSEGRLGRIYAIDGDYLYGRLEKITQGWRKDVPGYSVMEGGGIHLIDLMLWLLDERPETVATVGSSLATADTAFGYDDFMAAQFAFPSGAIGRITANFACVHPHHHVLRVFGTEGTFIYDDQGPRLMTSRTEDARAEPLDLDPLPAHKGVLVPDFVDRLLRGADAGPPARREFDLISTVAASDAALAAGRTVEIDYVKIDQAR